MKWLWAVSVLCSTWGGQAACNEAPVISYSGPFVTYRCHAITMNDLFGSPLAEGPPIFRTDEVDMSGHMANFNILYDLGEPFALVQGDFSYGNLAGQNKHTTLGPLVGRIVNDYALIHMQTSAMLKAFAAEHDLDLEKANARTELSSGVNVIYARMGDAAGMGGANSSFFSTQLKLFIPVAEMATAFAGTFSISVELMYLEREGAEPVLSTVWNKLYRAQCTVDSLREEDYQRTLTLANLEGVDHYGRALHRDGLDEGFWESLRARWAALDEPKRRRLHQAAVGTVAFAGVLTYLGGDALGLAARRVLALAGPFGALLAMTTSANADETLEGQLDFVRVDRFLRDPVAAADTMRQTFAQWEDLERFYAALGADLP